MPVVQFVGQSMLDTDNRAANSSRLINCHREAVGGRSSHVLKSVLGTSAFADIDAAFLRAIAQIEGSMYVVLGGRFYKISSAGVITNIGPVSDSIETTISGNNGLVTIVAGGSYYTWDGATLSQPATGAFSDFGSVTFIGQRTLLTERNGRRFQWSGVADAATLGGLDFATTESRDDSNLRAIPIGGAVWFFKELSIERWYQSGDTSFLSPISGGTIDTGLKAYGLVSAFPNGAAFVGNDNIVYMASAGGLQPISTVAVETSVSQNDPTHVFYYEDEGHKFCVVRFSDRPAWVYDISMGEWHERAETEDFTAWSAVGCVLAYGAYHIGSITGGIFKLERNSVDGSIPLVRQATGMTLRLDGNRFRVASLEFLGRVGRADLGRPAAMIMQLSKDYGETWSDERTASMGDIGDYSTRMIFRRLGLFRAVTPRVQWADQTDLTIDADATVVIA